MTGLRFLCFACFTLASFAAYSVPPDLDRGYRASEPGAATAETEQKPLVEAALPAIGTAAQTQLPTFSLAPLVAAYVGIDGLPESFRLGLSGTLFLRGQTAKREAGEGGTFIAFDAAAGYRLNPAGYSGSVCLSLGESAAGSIFLGAIYRKVQAAGLYQLCGQAGTVMNIFRKTVGTAELRLELSLMYTVAGMDGYQDYASMLHGIETGLIIRVHRLAMRP